MSIMKNYLSERQNHSFMSHKKAKNKKEQPRYQGSLLPVPTERKRGNLGTRLQKKELKIISIFVHPRVHLH